MFGGYRFGMGDGSVPGPWINWLLLAIIYAFVTWLIVKVLVRAGKVDVVNEGTAWLKVMLFGSLAVILLLVLISECLI